MNTAGQALDWHGHVRQRTRSVAFVDIGGRLVALHGPEIEPFSFSVLLTAAPKDQEFAMGASVSCSGLTLTVAGQPRTIIGRASSPAITPAANPSGLTLELKRSHAVQTRRRALAGVLNAAVDALRRSDHRQTVRLLLGWGPGLTPSGDDVLVGLAAGAALSGDPLAPRSLLSQACRRSAATTTVSAAILAEAARGRFAPALTQLGAHADPVRCRATVDRVARIGAHSGVDLLIGVALGLERCAG